jgi:RNA polymerase sigma factor (sigma-70 family)
LNVFKGKNLLSLQQHFVKKCPDSPSVRGNIRLLSYAGIEKQERPFFEAKYNDPDAVARIAPKKFKSSNGQLEVANRDERLSVEEEIRLRDERDKGNIAAVFGFILAYHHLIASVIDKFFSTSRHLDLMFVGQEALDRAATQYTGENGAQFTSFATTVIRNGTIDFLRQNRRRKNVSMEEMLYDGSTRTVFDIIPDPQRSPLQVIENDPSESQKEILNIQNEILGFRELLISYYSGKNKERDVSVIMYRLNPDGRRRKLNDVAAKFGISLSTVKLIFIRQDCCIEKAIAEFERRKNAGEI